MQPVGGLAGNLCHVVATEEDVATPVVVDDLLNHLAAVASPGGLLGAALAIHGLDGNMARGVVVRFGVFHSLVVQWRLNI